MDQKSHSWRPDRRVAWRAMDGRMVLVGGNEGRLYVLNGTGAQLWELVCAGATLDSMVSALESCFVVTADVARADVVRFIGQMEKRGLLGPCESA